MSVGGALGTSDSAIDIELIMMQTRKATVNNRLLEPLTRGHLEGPAFIELYTSPPMKKWKTFGERTTSIRTEENEGR